MKRIAILALAAFLAASGAAWAQGQAPSKIGVFDAQRISEETAEGKRIQTKLNGFRDKKQAEIVEKEKAVQALQEKLQAQTLSLSPDKRTELEKEIQRARARGMEEGKSAAVMDKMVEGALDKYRDEVALLRQTYIRDENLTVEKLIMQNVAAIGENVVVRRFQRWELGEDSGQP